MKAKDHAALLTRVRKFGGIVHVFPNDDVRFIEREIDRAVRKARREITDRGTECPVCGWKPKRAKKGTRT